MAVGVLEMASVDVLSCLPANPTALQDLSNVQAGHPAREVRNEATPPRVTNCHF
jgi:hypothetical protein